MRAVHWLHISDFHLHEDQSPKQEAVLAAMLEDIKRRCNIGPAFDFVLATGDLAFSGKESQYALVEEFFDNLATTIKLPRQMIFCVPGNHDIDRDQQKTCFAGARLTLRDQSAIYSFLADAKERETLLERQSNFRQFQRRYFQGQQREQTADDLGYVSVLDIDEIRIAIIGLNSAWLAEGGRSDDGQLLLGEQQVRSGVDIANKANPHVVIGIGHHPFDLLWDFDRSPIQRRLEEACHFFHCGHLHEPDASSVVSHSGNCLTLVAGASFASREWHNGYTTITLDPLNARTDVTFVQYDPRRGVFSNESKDSYPYEVDAAVSCAVEELGSAIERYCPAVADIAHYLAALLLGDMSEVPIHGDRAGAFGTVALLRKQPEDEFTAATENFLAVGNAIKLLHDRKSLDEILVANGGPIATYGEQLEAACKINDGLQAELAARETNARRLVDTGASGAFQHTLALLDELRATDEWDVLREQAERSCTLADPTLAAKAKRLLALCLARSTERADRGRAVDLYRELATSAQGEAGDWASLATLLTNDGDQDQAKVTVLDAIKAFPQSADGFVQIGMKIVEETGDVNFRALLSACRTKRGTT